MLPATRVYLVRRQRQGVVEDSPGMRFLTLPKAQRWADRLNTQEEQTHG